MFSNSFFFKKSCTTTEALITGLKYDKDVRMFELSLLGIGKDDFSYTNDGKAWMDEDDLYELMSGRELEFPQQLTGMRIKFISNNYRKEHGDCNEE